MRTLAREPKATQQTTSSTLTKPSRAFLGQNRDVQSIMNCWEAVLLSAYRAGAINWNWIHNLYVSTPPADWITAMSRGALHNYAIPGPNLRIPQRGDLVFFDGLAHVALATGKGSDVFTFWPPPNTPFTAGGTLDRVKVFTIEELVTWWEAHMPPAPTVEFAAPAW